MPATNSQVAAKNITVRAGDYSNSVTGGSAITLKTYSADQNNNVSSASYDLYLPAKNPKYLNGEDGNLETASKALMWNALNQKYEWGQVAGANLFIQGQTVTEHMDEQGNALTVAREVRLEPTDPGYDPNNLDQFKVEYKFTDQLENMKQFSASKVSYTQPQLLESTGLFYDWSSAYEHSLDHTTTVALSATNFVTNDDKAKSDLIVLKTNQVSAQSDPHFISALSNIEEVIAGATTASPGVAFWSLLTDAPVLSKTEADVAAGAGTSSKITFETGFNLKADELTTPPISDGMWINFESSNASLVGDYQITFAEGDAPTSFSIILNSAIVDGTSIALADYDTFNVYSSNVTLTLPGHNLAQDDVVKVKVPGLVENDFSTTDPLTGQKITYDGIYKVTAVDGNNFTLTYPNAPALIPDLAANAPAFDEATGDHMVHAHYTTFGSSPTKEQTKVSLEPHVGSLTHYSKDQTCSSVEAQRNEIGVSVLKHGYGTHSLTRLRNTNLPYESKITFAKSTKKAEYDALESGYINELGTAEWADIADKEAALSAVGVNVPVGAQEEGTVVQHGYFCIDNSEKKINTDMETFEFGPDWGRHRLYVGLDTEGLSRLYVQKYDSGSNRWQGADMVIDEVMNHTASIACSILHTTDGLSPDYNQGKFSLVISSLSGIVENVHVYLDDSHELTNSHVVIGSTAIGMAATDWNVTAGGEVTLECTTGGLAAGFATGDYFSIKGHSSLNGVYKITVDVSDDRIVTFTKASLTAGVIVNEGTVSFFKGSHDGIFDPGYAGLRKVVAYASDSSGNRVSEFSTVEVDNSKDTVLNTIPENLLFGGASQVEIDGTYINSDY